MINIYLEEVGGEFLNVYLRIGAREVVHVHSMFCEFIACFYLHLSVKGERDRERERERERERKSSRRLLALSLVGIGSLHMAEAKVKNRCCREVGE